MKYNESKIEELVYISNRLSEKGFGTSTSGNCSTRDSEYIYLTPTGVSLGNIKRDNISISDNEGNHIEGPKPTKEAGLHRLIYKKLPAVSCILHVHPVYSIALSMKLISKGIDLSPSSTPQFVMRCGRVPVLPYAHPGSRELVNVLENAELDKAVILSNHGVFTFGKTAVLAMNSLEELEENSRIIMTAGLNSALLSNIEIKELLNRKM